MSLAELEKNEIRISAIPEWKWDAARWPGQFFMPKVFPSYRIRSRWRPRINWFGGEPAMRKNGCVFDSDPTTIWLSAKLQSWEEIIRTSTHEHCHAFGIADEDMCEVIGALGAKAWSGSHVIYPYHGRVPAGWKPDNVDSVPQNGIVLELHASEAFTLVNDGPARFPRWRRLVIP